MKLPKRIKNRIFLYFRFIFHWKKPVFQELFVNDWVVEGKPLLVLKWKTTSAYYFKVRQTKFRSVRKEGFHVIKLPKDIDVVKIILSSGWRNSNHLVKLNKLTIPVGTESENLIKLIPVQPPVYPALGYKTSWNSTTRVPQPLFKKISIHTTQSPLEIKTFQFPAT